MEALIEMIYVDGNVIETCCRMFIFAFSIELVLGFANIIKTSYSSIRR